MLLSLHHLLLREHLLLLDRVRVVLLRGVRLVLRLIGGGSGLRCHTVGLQRLHAVLALHSLLLLRESLKLLRVVTSTFDLRGDHAKAALLLSQRVCGVVTVGEKGHTLKVSNLIRFHSLLQFTVLAHRFAAGEPKDPAENAVKDFAHGKEEPQESDSDDSISQFYEH